LPVWGEVFSLGWVHPLPVRLSRPGSSIQKTMRSGAERSLCQRRGKPWRWLIWFMKPSVA
jgi:hypothetical protein